MKRNLYVRTILFVPGVLLIVFISCMIWLTELFNYIMKISETGISTTYKEIKSCYKSIADDWKEA